MTGMAANGGVAWLGRIGVELSNEEAPCLPEMMFMSSQAEGGRVFDDRCSTWHGVPSWKGGLAWSECAEHLCGALVRSTSYGVLVVKGVQRRVAIAGQTVSGCGGR